MDPLAKEILKELLPAEKEVDPRAAKALRRGGHSAQGLDHWSSAVLLERAAYLRKLAKLGQGSASETLKEYPGHCAMLLFRGRDGMAEMHENFADLFCVLDGRATLITGGTVTDAQTVAQGEVRGASIEGGERQELKAGDVAHVPAGLPHQMLVTGEKAITCLVLKIQEKL